MQISRPNGGSLTSTSTRKAISSTSPLDGHSRSPLSSSNVATTATTRQLAGQMGSMSVNNSMASKAGLLSHKKSKSISASSSAVAGPSTSTTAANSSRGRLSPTKPQAIRQSSSSSSKTPSRNNATLLSKSAGPSTSARDAASHSLIAAGGLGRMDIATKDWDGITSTNSSSAGSSPNKRRPASISAKVCLYIQLIFFKSNHLLYRNTIDSFRHVRIQATLLMEQLKRTLHPIVTAIHATR